jgi:threonine dehydrogenase-like Zn-dependent dehydrogenase
VLAAVTRSPGHVVVEDVSLRIIGMHVDGGLQQRLEVPATSVFGVGDLDPECTALVEPTSVVVHALSRARLLAGEQVVVSGAGPIGLIAVIAAVAAGARVLAIEPVSTRCEIDVLGSSCATAADFGAAIKLVRAHRAAFSVLCSHRFPLARTAEAFEFAMSRPPDAIKVVVSVPASTEGD